MNARLDTLLVSLGKIPGLTFLETLRSKITAREMDVSAQVDSVRYQRNDVMAAADAARTGGKGSGSGPGKQGSGKKGRAAQGQGADARVGSGGRSGGGAAAGGEGPAGSSEQGAPAAAVSLKHLKSMKEDGGEMRLRGVRRQNEPEPDDAQELRKISVKDLKARNRR